jgi:hypothetical protein
MRFLRLAANVCAALEIMALLAPCHAATAAGDKDALLAARSALDPSDRVLSSWSAATDPCLDDWVGVKCNCFPFFEGDAPTAAAGDRPTACTPRVSRRASEPARVLQLNLGDLRITGGAMLEGAVPASLGGLVELRVLNLGWNNLTGALPAELARLEALEYLHVGGNRLQGRLPAFLGGMAALRFAGLDANAFEGPLPPEWCAGAFSTFDVEDNAGLCDEVRGGGARVLGQMDGLLFFRPALLARDPFPCRHQTLLSVRPAGPGMPKRPAAGHARHWARGRRRRRWLLRRRTAILLRGALVLGEGRRRAPVLDDAATRILHIHGV